MKRTLSLFLLLSGFGFAQSFVQFDDDFNSGLGNWLISSQGNSCVWENYFPPYPGPYTIPDAQDGIMAADADQCSSSVNTTAVLDTIIDISGYFCVLFLQWDNDWNATDNNDTAFVEISFDLGISWEAIWEKDGVSARNSVEYAYYDEYLQTDVDYAMLRLRTVQNGSGSWWAIDNFSVMISSVIEMPATPTNLTAQLAGQNAEVLLNWEFTATPSYELGFQITRKLGPPWPYNNYEILDSVDISLRSYIDTTAQDNLQYTYRIRSYSYQFYSFLSEAAVIITPVEFISFSAIANESDIRLFWSTSTETNNSGFEIERSSGDEWKAIAFIPGKGNSTVRSDYSYTDSNLKPAEYRYRLKQTDYDGSYQYSNVATAEITKYNQFVLYQNYPNPFNPSTIISYYIPEMSRVRINVYNILSQSVAVLVNENQDAGFHSIDFNAGRLPGGVYFYQIQYNSYSKTKKMILLK